MIVAHRRVGTRTPPGPKRDGKPTSTAPYWLAGFAGVFMVIVGCLTLAGYASGVFTLPDSSAWLDPNPRKRQGFYAAVLAVVSIICGAAAVILVIVLALGGLRKPSNGSAPASRNAHA